MGKNITTSGRALSLAVKMLIFHLAVLVTKIQLQLLNHFLLKQTLGGRGEGSSNWVLDTYGKPGVCFQFLASIRPSPCHCRYLEKGQELSPSTCLIHILYLKYINNFLKILPSLYKENRTQASQR